MKIQWSDPKTRLIIILGATGVLLAILIITAVLVLTSSGWRAPAITESDESGEPGTTQNSGDTTDDGYGSQTENTAGTTVPVIPQPLEPDANQLAALSHNVKGYGAKGDGKTDDTAAFQAAISASQKDGAAVHVPSGSYVISTPLMLISQTMFGYDVEDIEKDADKLPTLVFTQNDKPCLVANSSAVSGIHVSFQDKNNTGGWPFLFLPPAHGSAM